VLCYRGIFHLLFFPGSLKGCIPVLEGNGDVNNITIISIILQGFVNCDEVWSQGPIKARYCLVDSNSGGFSRFKRSHQSVQDGVMALGDGHKVRFAVT
jgi:hypothetical protein